MQRDARIRPAEQLLRDRRLDEAALAFRQLLDQGIQDPRVLQGYQQARALLAAQAEEARIVPLAPPGRPPQAAPPQPVGPPRALTVRTPQRSGFRLPGALRRLRLPRRLDRPRVLLASAGAAALVILALGVYGVHRREAALREAVATAKRNALKPVSRMVEIPSLAEPWRPCGPRPSRPWA